MGEMSERTAITPNADEMRDMYARIHEKNLFPFWAQRSDVEHDEIRQLMAGARAQPFHWSYTRDLEALMLQSARLINTGSSDRRSLILVNPGLRPRRATVTTMYTAYRINDPNEMMPPHKHTASAIRLGLTGSENFTGVEGEDIVFGHGDMVLTPVETWHNHGCVGNEPALNLSVLDYPLVEVLNALEFGHDYQEDGVRKRQQTARFSPDYSRKIYGTGGATARFVSHARGVGASSPMYVYRYDMMREVLERNRDAESLEGLVVEYTDPIRGGPVFKTMTFFLQMLRPGEKTAPISQNASLLISPLEGRAICRVDDQHVYDAEFRDTIAVPGNHWMTLENPSATTPAVLFIASDEPALAAFGLLRRVARTPGGDIVKLG